jgi:hypothetical protein
MRVSPAAVLLAVLPSVASCGPCWNTHVATTCGVTGDVSGTFSDGQPFDNRSSGLSATCPTVSFGGRNYSGGALPATAPQDLNLGLTFQVRITTVPVTPGSAFTLPLKLAIRSVPLGPSEFDLDDARATLEGHDGLQGHIGITELSQDCSSHGDNFCLLALHATVSVSAGGNGGTLTLTDVVLDAQDMYARTEVMCAVIGE